MVLFVRHSLNLLNFTEFLQVSSLSTDKESNHEGEFIMMFGQIKKSILLLIISISVNDPVFSQNQEENEKLINKLFVDLNGRKPQQSLLEDYLGDFAKATSMDGLRIQIHKLLVGELFKSEFFVRRLINYFNSIFGVTINHGLVLPICTTAQTQNCITEETAQDFKNELAASLALRIADQSLPKDQRDIRLSLTSTFTSITPRMATALKSSSLRQKLGMSNSDITGLDPISASNKLDTWSWWNRDTSGLGLPTGTSGHNEVHSGILTSPAYLLKNRTHLARAYSFFNWFLSKDIAQISGDSTDDFKLAQKKPCADCHSQLEPTGSFWIHWRAKINANDLSADWILDGVTRKITGSELESPDSGRIPVDDEQSRHSRTLVGSYYGSAGTGVKALTALATADDANDFAYSMTNHMWQFMQGRKTRSDEKGWIRLLASRLKTEHAWDLREVLVDIAMTKAYFRPEVQTP